MGTIFLGVFLLTLVCATSAQAKVGASEVGEYQKDFGVSAQQAEDALEIQDAANEADLAGQLEARLGPRYAGLWFDNVKREYVVPVLAGTDATAVESEFDEAGLKAADFRMASARSSWAHLEEAQHQVDSTLLHPIEDGFLDTSLDPRTDAVVVTQTSGAGAEVAGLVQEADDEAPVEVEVRKIGLARFDSDPEACSEPFCDAPLRGGVQINPPGVPATHCTAGFPAIGANGSRYLVTAGHCVEIYPGASPVLYWESKDSALQPHYIGKAEEWEHEWFDWAKINANGSKWDAGPWFSEIAYWGEPILDSKGSIIGKTPPVNLDYSITGEAANVVGNYACHSGIMTGTSCGYITGVNVSHSKAEHITFGLNKLANACSAPGDSGGPYFMGHSALGLHVDSQDGQKVCGDTLYYTDIQKATAALHVSIANPPPAWKYENLGGTLTSDPDPSSWGKNNLNVFARGTDAAIWRRSFNGSSWAPWESTGCCIVSGPSAVSWTPGRIDVVARINDNSIGHWYTEGGPWYYDNLGGTFQGDPTIISGGYNNLSVFARGTDNAIYRKTWNGSWSSWANSGCCITSSPAAVSWGGWRYDVVARVAGNSVGHWYSPNAGANVYYDNLGGTFSNDLDIASPSPERLDVFAPDNNGYVWHKWWTGTAWSEWTVIDGPVTGGVGAVEWGLDRIDLFGRAGDGSLQHWLYSP